MTLVGTGTAAHTDVHEHFKGPKFVKSFTHSLKNNLNPVLRELPVITFNLPFTRFTKNPGQTFAQIFYNAFLRWITVVARLEGYRDIHPVLAGNGPGHHRRFF